MPAFAFFDLDHTLLPFDTQLLFCNYVLRRERWRMLWHAAFVPFALLKAARLVRTVTAKRAFMFYLHGMDRERLLAHARSFASEVVRPWVYPELRQIVEGHRQAGRILVLNTASPDFYAREIARELGFDHCVATQVEVPESFPLMVKVIGENNKREAKIAAMKQKVPAVATAGEASLSDSWSYSDSSADLPLLEFAGHGVLVHPSASLEALGRERGWEVIHPARPYSGRAGDMFCALRQFFGLYGVAPPSQGGCGFALSRATEEA